MPAEVNNIADIDLVARVVRHYGTDTLASLLRDRSAERNIIWASSEYERLGDGYEPYAFDCGEGMESLFSLGEVGGIVSLGFDDRSLASFVVLR